MNGTDARTVLEKRLRSTTDPWDRLPILMALIRELQLVDPKGVHRYAMEAYTIARKLNDPFWIACSLSTTCVELIRVSRHSKVLPILQTASRMFARINGVREKADTDLVIAKTYLATGDYTQAMKTLLECLHIYRSIDAFRGMTDALITIGDIHRQSGDWARGLKYYRNAGKVIKQSDSEAYAAMLYIRLTACYRIMENSERACSYAFKSLKIFRQNADKSGTAVAVANIGNCYLDQDRFFEAEKYVRISLKLYHELGFVHYEALSWARLGSIYEHRKEFENAYRCFRKGIALIRSCEDPVIRGQIYENFGGLCILMKRTEQGFLYLRKAIPLIEGTGHPQHLYNSYAKLALACEATGDAQGALEYYKKSAAIKEEYISGRKIMEASYAEMKVKVKPIVKRLKSERAKNDTLKKVIEQKEAELLSLTLKMIQDDEERSNTKLRGPAKVGQNGGSHRSNGLSKNWETFNRQFHKVHHEFYVNLVRRFPELTPAEVKVCSLIRIGLSSKEIGGVLCISPRTVESHRMRVHRKMELPTGTSLAGFIARL